MASELVSSLTRLLTKQKNTQMGVTLLYSGLPKKICKAKIFWKKEEQAEKSLLFCEKQKSKTKCLAPTW